MAGVNIASKRRSPDTQDEAERDAPSLERIKRVKKERREPVPSQEQQTAQEEESSSDEDMDEAVEEEDGGVLDEQNIEDGMNAYRAAREVPNRYAGELREAGVVKSITLTDFMCHRHMTADFGGKMNFLVGHNGSGKSAILTGIAVALGGKASATGRGSGFRDLIRRGADKAVITLTLANSGTDAHKPELFNPYIVIERTIPRYASAYWRFRASKDGKSLGDKRQLLTDILEAFQIHVDSPLTVLTQDQARSFLQSSDPSSLYKFFMQGTLLQSLVESYQAMNDKLKDLRRIHAAEKERLPALQQVKDRLYGQEQSSRRILLMRTEADECNKELGWAYVAEKEKDVQGKQEELDAQIEKITQAKAKIIEEESKAAEAKGLIEHLEAEVHRLSDGEAPITKRRNNQRANIDKIRKAVAELRDSAKASKDSVESHRREVQVYDEKIHAQQQTATGQDPEIAQLRDRINEYTRGLHNLTRQRPKLEQDVQLAEENVASAQEAEEQAKGNWEQAQQAENGRQETIHNLKAQANNRLAAFGQRMDLVMNAIARARWVHSKPIGPLGMHVKLKDMRYRDAFHQVIGSQLCQFAVRCSEDRQTMLDILKDCGTRGYRAGSSNRGSVPQVITHGGDVYTFSEGDLSEVNETMLSILEFDNEKVKRILIDGAKIESTFIWPQIKGPTGVAQRYRELIARGLKSCSFITADGYRANAVGNNESSGPLSKYTGNILLTDNVQNNLEELRKEHALLASFTRDAKAEHLRLVETRKEAIGKKAEAQRRLESCKKGIDKFESQLDKLREQLADKETADTGVDLSEARMDAYGKQLYQERQLEGIQHEIEQRLAQIQEDERALRATEAELEGLAPERIQATNSLSTLAEQRHKSIQDAEFYRKQITRYEASKANLQLELGQLQDELDRWTVEATRISGGVRIQSNRTVQEIERKREAANKSIARAERDTGTSVQEITQRLKAADEKLELATETVKQMEKLADMADRAIANRRRFWRSERQRNALTATCVFISSMEHRDMEGDLRFDHDNSQLFVRVRETGLHTQTTQTGEAIQSARQYKTPKTMSGGERSFTTVSLLLAMWELSPGPIRCLDEWDVFLDAANRGVAAQMLLDGAKASDGTQYLLITPLDMNGIEINGAGNKVIRMADPIRNQGTLPFQPA